MPNARMPLPTALIRLALALTVVCGTASVPARPERPDPQPKARAAWTILLFSMADCAEPPDRACSTCCTSISLVALTPLSALALGELATRAGIPAGVLNIVTGPGAAVGMGESAVFSTYGRLGATGRNHRAAA